MTERFKVVSIFLVPVILILLFVAPAFSATIGFEGLTSEPDDVVQNMPHLEAGFVLWTSSEDYGIFNAEASDVNTNGSDVFGWCGNCGDEPIWLQLTHGDDLLFSIYSLQATNHDPGYFEQGMGINVVGELVGGATVGESFYFDENTFTTFFLPDTFTNLVSLDIYALSNTSPDLVMDNLVVDAIPIPGAVWLLGSGLIGLFGIRRKFKG